MTQRPLLVLLSLSSIFAAYACDVSTIGSGMDTGGTAGKPETGGSSGDMDDGTAASEGGEETRAGTGGAPAMGTGGSSTGKGGTSSVAGRGGSSQPSVGGAMATSGRGGSSAGRASAGTGGMTGVGANGMGAVSGMQSTGMGATAGAPSGCEVNTMDTKQGGDPPAAEDCADLGAAQKDAHDKALTGKTLDVEPLVGTWADGTGSGRVELVLGADGSGTLRFGEAADFPTIDDPDEAFLSGIGGRDAGHVFDLSYEKEQPGFGYTVIAESGRGSEMSFHITSNEAWENWCSLQTPVASPVGRSCYACMYDAGLYSYFTDVTSMSCAAHAGCFEGDHDSAEANRVDCGRMDLCLMPYDRVCHCTEDECFANVEGNGQLTEYPFTVTLDPVDTTILRLKSLSELVDKTTYYLAKEE